MPAAAWSPHHVPLCVSHPHHGLREVFLWPPQGSSGQTPLQPASRKICVAVGPACSHQVCLDCLNVSIHPAHPSTSAHPPHLHQHLHPIYTPSPVHANTSIYHVHHNTSTHSSVRPSIPSTPTPPSTHPPTPTPPSVPPPCPPPTPRLHPAGGGCRSRGRPRSQDRDFCMALNRCWRRDTDTCTWCSTEAKSGCFLHCGVVTFQ